MSPQEFPVPSSSPQRLVFTRPGMTLGSSWVPLLVPLCVVPSAFVQFLASHMYVLFLALKTSFSTRKQKMFTPAPLYRLLLGYTVINGTLTVCITGIQPCLTDLNSL